MNEKVSVKKVCERFTRHLNKASLGETIHNGIIEMQCRDIGLDTAVIIDDSDIVKSKAKQMEGLKKVRDGSRGTHHQLGYDLLNIIAVDNATEGYDIKPVSSDLLSMKIEEDSLIQITEDRMVEIALASGNKGVYVLDRGYDRRAVFNILKTHEFNYIIRSTAKRDLIVENKEQSFLKVAKSIKLKYSYKA